MIQSSQPKPIETTAPVRAEVSGKSNKALMDLEGSLEAQDFANELEASLAGEAEISTDSEVIAKVKPVAVSAEQVLELPSTLVNQETGNVETTSPKVFDPALTKGVEKLIQPKTTEVLPVEGAPVNLTDAEVLEIANAKGTTEVKGEIAQALLKTPQLAKDSGRAPAIDFAKSEIDPQLLNMEDFVAQKNLSNKKSIPNAYGMKTIPQQEQKIALENRLKQTQVINEAAAVDSAPVNSQQFILNMMSEQDSAPKVNETQAAPKVFDMSNIKTTNTNEIINQISNYVAQGKAAKEPTVNMRVNHEQLGMIDITVSKAGVNHESVAVNIGAHSMEGKQFFQQNSKDLFSHLSTAGINVSDIKVETPNQTARNDFDFGSQSGRNQHGDKQFGSEQNQRRHEQERRQDLWKLLNQEAA